jgi:tRNA-specific adenosine deaminase 3
MTTRLWQPTFAHDTRRSTAHPLRHAVMNLMRKVADYRVAPSSYTEEAPKPVEISSAAQALSFVDINTTSRNGSHYLLTSLTCFLSHEPCIMCSMALLHSRVKEVYYLKSMERTGGCGGSACIPKLEGVNHRFGIAKWKTGGEDLTGDALDIDEATDV